MVTEKASDIKSLPNELLEKIFGYIKYKTEISLVCKSWYLVAGEITRFAYYEDDVLKFGKALQGCQGLRDRVRSVRVNRHRLYTNGSSNVFMSIVFPFCRNLVELTLDINPSNSTYLQKLCDTYNCRGSSTTTPMPKLQRVGVCRMFYCWSYANLLNQSRDSLTDMNLEIDHLLTKVDQSGLSELLASFNYCLKNLSLDYKDYLFENNLDRVAFPSLFVFANRIGLEGLKVLGKVEYRFAVTNLKKLSDNNDAPTNSSVKNLELIVQRLDILCLQYITKKLKKIQSLAIHVDDVVIVRRNTMALEEAEIVIENFRSYCEEVEGEVNVDFFYEGRRGRKEWIQIPHK